MIHINLLPPELRKRRTGVSPVSMSLVAGGIVCLLMACGAMVVHWHVTAAEALHTEKTNELAEKKAKAEAVAKLEADIADAKKHRDYLVTLLLQKMYWARTLDEFANTINGPWSMTGYDVRCLDLTISPAQEAQPMAGGPRRGQGQSEVAYSFVWRYKLLGKELALHGDYIQSFFNTLAASKLWNEQGFVGRPADSYRGHAPKWDAGIDTLLIENSLQWRRSKVVSADKPATATGGK